MFMMGMGVVMMMSRRTNRVPSITACAHVLEALKAIVRLGFAMQLKLELVILPVP